MSDKRRLTLDDLARVEGQAELVDGRIIHLGSLGYFPAVIVGNLLFSLSSYSDETGKGETFGPTLAYAIEKLPSARESFSPDNSFYDGPHPENPMAFIQGPPTFAAEIRNEREYGEAAEVEMAVKRADYFAAGTVVVWDVDPIAETVAVYRATDAGNPVVYRRGDIAAAEPAVPGWRIPVDEIFSS